MLSLFSGIGGLDLGLTRAGLRVVGQVEADPLCRSILARHWPEVARHDDVRTCSRWWNSCPRPAVDVVAGGFPCQPFSIAGHRRGTGDQRWLWPAMADTIRDLRPRYVLVENVPGLLGSGMGAVLGDLAGLGFDADWSIVSACAVGAPHVRRRLFILAYSVRELGSLGVADSGARQAAVGRPICGLGCRPGPWGHPVDGLLAAERGSRRVVDGVPDRLESACVRALGNAVVPQVATRIGQLLMAVEARRMTAGGRAIA